MLQAEEDVKFTISDLSLDVMFSEGRFAIGYWKAETKALVKVHMHEILQIPLLAISTFETSLAGKNDSRELRIERFHSCAHSRRL